MQEVFEDLKPRIQHAEILLWANVGFQIAPELGHDWHVLKHICTRYSLHKAKNWDPAARAASAAAPEHESGEVSPVESRSVTPEEGPQPDADGEPEVAQHLCGRARAEEFLTNAYAPDQAVPPLRHNCTFVEL